MNNKEINRAIAEHLGWKWFDHPDTRERTKTFTLSDKWVLNPAGQLVFPYSVRNYCGDLNAMHEAEGVLGPKWVSYCEQLLEIAEPEPRTLEVCHYWNLLHATARQRAEAFLRVVGKWRGEE